MSDWILEAEGLVKSYGGTRVVDGIDLHCRPGAILGLLGPNGAGKTTTLRMLYGFIEPEEGTLRYEGRDFGSHRTELKRLIGVCTQEDTLDYDFSVRQNLEVYASYFRPRVADPRARAQELLERFDLLPYADHTPQQLSGGYKRRLLIARSVVHHPRILFLDEPTTGLDPRARVDVWELVDRMRADGMAIILTTHYMDEAEKLSDDLLVLSRGRVLAHDTPNGVLGDLVGDHVLTVPGDVPERDDIRTWLASELGARPPIVLGELRAALTNEQLSRFTERFRDARFGVRSPNLDDLFLELSGAPAPEEPASEVA